MAQSTQQDMPAQMHREGQDEVSTQSLLTGVWTDLVGQEAAVAQLRQAAQSAHEILAASGPATTETAEESGFASFAMTHAWLVCGPPGSGRSLAGRAFAAALQCEQGTGCGQCKGCRTTMHRGHPDVSLVDTDAVTIRIDEVAQLVAGASQSPTAGKWRVIVIEDADRMQERTTNLLLKSIEEPAERTVWVLCAPAAQDLLPTIRSRCRVVQLRVPPVEAVADLLQRRHGVDVETALRCAQQAQSHIGSAQHLATTESARKMRERIIALPGAINSVPDALKAAETLIAQAKAQYEQAAQQRAETETAELVRALGYEDEKDVPAKLRPQLRALDETQKRRATRSNRDVIERALLDIMGLYRDVLLWQLDGGGVKPINGDRTGTIQRIAQQSHPAATIARIEAIQVARRRIAANVPPLLAVEAMMVTFRPQFAAAMRH